MKIIKQRKEKWYINREKQCGFTTGRSCIDHIFILRIVLEKCKENSKHIGLILIQVDVEKTNDSSSRKLLWQEIRETLIDEKRIKMLKSYIQETDVKLSI